MFYNYDSWKTNEPDPNVWEDHPNELELERYNDDYPQDDWWKSDDFIWDDEDEDE